MTLDVRRAVLDYLGNNGDPRFGQPYLVGTIHRETGCSQSEVWETLWRLVSEGLIYLDTAGQGSGSDNWRWCLSADGNRVVSGGTWEPRDPDGYLARIRREIPDLDQLVELYLTEALHSYNARCYLATSVMLGVAAERAFLAMAKSYGSSTMPGARTIAKELERSRSNYFALWLEFRKRIDPVRQDLPDGLGDALTLDAIADLIRLTRNEAGHPTGRLIDADTALVHLTIAPMYLRKMQLLSAHFTQLPAESEA